ncbi:uncharacterized protein [Ptychodera flava]|uniref:uncharacterized protein isoform X1 n=1 Tax=Ptychodera flava TaxID=63121 RepID=UPI00396A6AFB
MLMNFQAMMIKHLYNEDSRIDIGTLSCEKTRLGRTQVNEDVKLAYDANKDFILSFTDAYIVEALMHYFGMSDLNSTPCINCPPAEWPNNTARTTWIDKHIGSLVEKYVLAGGMEALQPKSSQNLIVDGIVVSIELSNGTMLDVVLNYGHKVLELGLLYKALLDLCKLPDRDRGLRLLKLTMMYLKASNNLSKYAYEIMRLLVHQFCILSEKEAHEEFYGLFVNTHGKLDSHIPVDLQMVYIVKSVKKSIKHMYSNQTEKNISRRSGSLSGINEISQNFDKCTNVLVRADKHSVVSSLDDELTIIKDLQTVKPFDHNDGRHHP